MDTLIKQNGRYDCTGRFYEYLVCLFILFLLLCSNTTVQPAIYANDLIANTIIRAPNLKNNTTNLLNYKNYEIEKEKFYQIINTKYANYKINNLSDGIVHIKLVKYYSGKPVRINIIELNEKIAKDYELKPATASNYTLHHKTTLRTIVWRTNAIAAINGGFFKPQTGVPLGTLVIDKKMYTGPIYNRVAMGIFNDGYDVARIQFNGKIYGNNQEITIDNINQPRMLSSFVLAYTRDWGEYAPASPRYGVQLQIEGNKILAASANPLSIPKNGYVIVGPKDKLQALFGADNVKIDIKTVPQWENVKHIISGGPFLVRNGEIFVDVKEEKLLSITGKNPRTAIGYTKENNLIMVTVDGREGSSVGLTLTELANFMKSIGCINAINLDGGGSTVMFAGGNIVNNPQQIGGIALSNAIVIAKKN